MKAPEHQGTTCTLEGWGSHSLLGNGAKGALANLIRRQYLSCTLKIILQSNKKKISDIIEVQTEAMSR